MKDHIVRISKFMSLVLRHNPQAIGLQLDAEGWVRIEDLLLAAQHAGIAIDRSVLESVVRQNNKQRFSISHDGQRIRANQGHSIPVDLGLEPITPPPILYHGTATRFLQSIREHGLLKGHRQHVHLSTDQQSACNVGSRHGHPIVLTVDAANMLHDGYHFYRSHNGVYLTEHIPPQYLSGW